MPFPTSFAPIRRELAETLLLQPGSEEGVLPPLMILLTVVTGVVDAVAYLELGHVFVANMTGNVVFLGFAAAGATGLSVTGSLLALGFFLVGSIASARLTSRLGDSRLHNLRDVTGVQLAFFAAAILVAALVGDHPGRGDRYTLIAVLAVAMGIQNATARRLAVPDLTTTVLTLTLTGIAADSWLGGGSGARTTRRVLAVVSMLLGATVGALLVLKVALVAPLILGAGILAIVCAGGEFASRHVRAPAA